jgi:hypothetical protein
LPYHGVDAWSPGGQAFSRFSSSAGDIGQYTVSAGGFDAVHTFLGEHLAEQAGGGASPYRRNKDGTPRHLFTVPKEGVIRFFLVIKKDCNNSKKWGASLSSFSLPALLFEPRTTFGFYFSVCKTL